MLATRTQLKFYSLVYLVNLFDHILQQVSCDAYAVDMLTYMRPRGNYHKFYYTLVVCVIRSITPLIYLFRTTSGVTLSKFLYRNMEIYVRFCNLVDWSLYGRDLVHTCLWHSPLNSTMRLFVYGCAVQVLLTVQYTWTHIM